MDDLDHIAFDLHGVLTEAPHVFKIITSMLVAQGMKISIMSGPSREEVVAELTKLGYERGIHYQHVISIVDYLRHKGIELWKDKKGGWETHAKEWWSSKGELCKEFKVGLIIDDSPEYEAFVDKAETVFLLLKGQEDECNNSSR